MDTQWPRWEVFKQDTPTKPHQAVGSVHATDPEHALLTARNIFARRPQAVSMWVAPESRIFSITAEQLAEGQLGLQKGSETTAYCIFRKTSHKRSMTFVDYVDTLEATSPQEAVYKAIQQFTDTPALAWWAVAEASLVKSEPDLQTIESWFEPARGKTYMQQQYYATIGSHVSKHKPSREGSHDE